jgi:hypothetical protein
MPLGWPPATLVRLPLGATCWSHRHWLRMLRRSGALLPLQLRPPYQACATLMGLPLRWALGLQQQRRQALARALFYGLHFKPKGEDSGCTMPFSALPQDLVPLQEVGSPPATGALLHGPSAPTIVLPHVAQAPCSTIQVYSHQQKKRSENNAADSSPVQDFIAELIKPVGGLVPRLISKRRAKRLLADFVPRCSTRLAKNRAGATSAATRHIQ